MAYSRAVALCCDANYLPYTAFVASQIALSPVPRSFDIYICSSDELVLPQSLLGLGVQSIRIDQSEQLQRLKSTHLPVTAYLRLWLPQALGDRHERILYMDGDVYIEAADLNRLLDIDLKGRPVGAIRDMQQWLTPNKHVREFVDAGLPRAPYFNSGVLVMDVPSFNALNILGRCLELCAERPEVIHHHDQSALNCVLHGQWTELSPLWNWQWAGKRPIWSLGEAIQIAHFAGTERKPWNDPHGWCPPRYAAHWETFIRHHFPDFRSVGVVAPSKLNDRKQLFKLFAEHWMIHGRIRRYIDQFPTLDTSRPVSVDASSPARSFTGKTHPHA